MKVAAASPCFRMFSGENSWNGEVIPSGMKSVPLWRVRVASAVVLCAGYICCVVSESASLQAGYSIDRYSSERQWLFCSALFRK
jgi:hypothetical protein